MLTKLIARMEVEGIEREKNKKFKKHVLRKLGEKEKTKRGEYDCNYNFILAVCYYKHLNIVWILDILVKDNVNSSLKIRHWCSLMESKKTLIIYEKDK